ncbi:aminoglycoside phosphotransferase family protein [Clostridium hydrogeniformans]|uniref:aminoglycoside phosphotransferase family protein n=1 Tax=Clostridium hydrogeniformans TaxID=349933 RepID=UPI00048610E7|nr:aminoglycoside phosphotransferase family protein [Clostridium hydrogeniformans]
MLDYSIKDIYNLLKDLLKETIIDIEPVGNHDINRHLVYKVYTKGKNKILKIYYKKNKIDNEVIALRLLEDTKVKSPKNFLSGEFENGDPWLLYDFIEGVTLKEVIKTMPEEKKEKLFEEIGRELGKLHSSYGGDYFGPLGKVMKGESKEHSYYNKSLNSIDEYRKVIETLDLPHKELIDSGFNYLYNNLNLINIEVKPTLCHGDYNERNILVKEDYEGYTITSIIDFETNHLGNNEEDLVSLYLLSFRQNKDLERKFLKGYSKFETLYTDFNKRLKFYMIKFILGNCTWSYSNAKDYYNLNIQWLYEVLNEE